MYKVFNRITGITKEFKTRVQARKYADRTDLKYGAIICSVSVL